MRYWIVTELFYPEEVSTGYIMTKIAEGLSSRVSVGVICGPSGYQSKVLKANYEINPKILVKRVSVPSFDKNKIVLRVIGFLILTLGFFFKILFNVSKKDKLILVTNPPSLLPVISFLKLIKGFKYTIIVHDVFPENAIAGGLLNKHGKTYKIILSIINWSYKKADDLIVVGRDMRDLFEIKTQMNKPINVITNWADHEMVYPLEDFDLKGYYSLQIEKEIIIQFAGNIGRVQGLDMVFNTIEHLQNENLHFIFIGSGALKDSLIKKSESMTFRKIHFLPPKSRIDQQLFLNACHIGLVTLSPGMYGLGVPSKVYNIMAAGKPILYIGDKNSEIYLYIIDHEIGWAFTWDEQKRLNQFLSKLNYSMLGEIISKGSKARKLVENKFTKDFIIEEYNDVIINGRY
jgi:glycosyltransferase involved in cell wall biosynthesis